MRPISRLWLITGTSSGLGFEIAKHAVSAGDRIVGCVRKQADAERVEALGETAHAALLDVTDRAAVMRAACETVRNHGPIDIAVNNAGYGLIGPIEEISEAEARAQFDVNFFGALWFIQAVLEHMRDRTSGHIINITSVSGLAPWAGTGLYTASKYALEGLAQTLHDEVKPLGIDVTNVAPGGLRTQFAKGSMAMPERRIAAYYGLARLPQSVFKDGAGTEPGDPIKAAKAVVDIAGMNNPPRHLLLGADALGYWREANAKMAAEIARYENITTSIAADDA